MNDRHDIAVIINSHTSLISIKTKEENRAIDLLKAIKATKSLSIVMDKKIAALRDWASSRTVPAN